MRERFWRRRRKWRRRRRRSKGRCVSWYVARVGWGHLSLYLRMYWVGMKVSPSPPGLHWQLRSLVLRDQQVRLTGFWGGTAPSGGRGERRGEERRGEGKREC